MQHKQIQELTRALQELTQAADRAHETIGDRTVLSLTPELVSALQEARVVGRKYSEVFHEQSPSL